jgi:hypothetical protein
MLETLLCLLSLMGVSGLEALAHGAQVQVTSADLRTVLASGRIEGGKLALEAEYRPLADIVLIIMRPPKAPRTVQNVSSVSSSDIISLSGFISPSARDIMVQEAEGTLSLKDWLQEQQISLDLNK